MFPHTITIYRHTVRNHADAYDRQTVRGVYWFGGNAVTVSGKGLEASHPVTVITSPETAAEFPNVWDCRPGDRIIRGSGGAISSWKDLPAAVTVRQVDDNRCGGAADNITIGCE